MHEGRSKIKTPDHLCQRAYVAVKCEVHGDCCKQYGRCLYFGLYFSISPWASNIALDCATSYSIFWHSTAEQWLAAYRQCPSRGPCDRTTRLSHTSVLLEIFSTQSAGRTEETTIFPYVMMVFKKILTGFEGNRILRFGFQWDFGKMIKMLKGLPGLAQFSVHMFYALLIKSSMIFRE